MKNIKIWITRIILSASLFMIAAGAQAATRTVTKTADTDDGVCNADCSLREAIDVANPGDRIIFSSLFNTPQTIPYNGGLTISTNLTIIGTGADLLTISSNGGGALVISSGNTVNISDLTIAGSGASGISNYGDLTISNCVITGNAGSGVANNGDLTIDNCLITENAASGIKNFLGTLLINHSTISENTGSLGGGIESEDDLIITNSTVSNNTANALASGGGGIYSTGSLTVTNSTVSGNTKLGSFHNGGGIYHRGTTTITGSTITNNSVDGTPGGSGVFKEDFAGLLRVRNSIIAANVDNSIKPDVEETSFGTSSDGYNLIGNDGTVSVFSTGVFNFIGDQRGTAAAPLNPLLDPLDDYGGMTATHRLQTNSTAIDKGDSFGLTEDQRGFLRPYDKPGIPNSTSGDGSDIGAYELQFAVFVTGGIYNPLGVPIRNVRVLLRGANGLRRAVRTDRFGVYRFNNVARNRIYQVSVTHRQYEFIPQIIMVREENISDLNFTALP